MKTKLNSILRKLYTFLFFILVSTGTYAQFTQVWVTVNEYNGFQIDSFDGRSVCSDPAIQAEFNKLHVISCKKAFPASKSPELNMVYELEAKCDAYALLSSLSKFPKVFSKAELAPTYELLNDPNDYSLTFSTDYGLDLINARQAWDITTGSASTVIAISDQNFAVDHEELVGKVVNYDPNNGASTIHGTAVAVVAAGKTNNGVGKAAIGYDCALGLYQMNYNQILVASYAGSRVINVSWAAGCTYSNYGQQVINEAYNNGSIIVAAAGNGGTCGSSTSLVYPAAFNHVIAVSSVGPNDNHERYPGDPSSTHQHNSSVDLMAPGYDVPLSCGPGWYLTGNGSSFAAPSVAGTIGLMLSLKPCLTFEQVEKILKATAVNIDALNPTYAGSLGAGRLDAGAALAFTVTAVYCDGVVVPGGSTGSGSGNTFNGEVVIENNAGNDTSEGNNGGGDVPLPDTDTSASTGGYSNVYGNETEEDTTVTGGGAGNQNSDPGEAVGSFGNGSNRGESNVNSSRNNPGWISFNSDEIVQRLKNKYSLAKLDSEYILFADHFERKTEMLTPQNEEQQVLVYPNPANRGAAIQFESVSSVQIVEVWSLNGSLILRTDSFNGQMDSSSLEPGVYVIAVSTLNGKTSTQKLVIN